MVQLSLMSAITEFLACVHKINLCCSHIVGKSQASQFPYRKIGSVFPQLIVFIKKFIQSTIPIPNWTLTRIKLFQSQKGGLIQVKSLHGW